MNKKDKTTIFKGAKESLSIIKLAGGNGVMRISITDRVYFEIQTLLQNRINEPIKALNQGKALKTTAHQAFVEQYAVTRDGTEEQKAQEANQNQQEKETEALEK